MQAVTSIEVLIPFSGYKYIRFVLFQYVTEKMGGAEGTKLDLDFVEMERVSTAVAICFYGNTIKSQSDKWFGGKYEFIFYFKIECNKSEGVYVKRVTAYEYMFAKVYKCS